MPPPRPATIVVRRKKTRRHKLLEIENSKDFCKQAQGLVKILCCFYIGCLRQAQPSVERLVVNCRMEVKSPLKIPIKLSITDILLSPKLFTHLLKRIEAK